MDNQRFDHLAKALSGGLSRRGVLRGAAAGIAGAIGLRASWAGAAQEKKPVCHYTGSASNPWQVIEVAEPAYLTHLGHGDHDFVDCCDDAACAGFNTCGGGGVDGQCGCTALTYDEACGDLCSGEVSDGCGGSHVCSCVVVDPTLTVSVSALDGSPHACWVVVSVSGFPVDSVLYPTFQDWWNIGGVLHPIGSEPWTSPHPISLDASGSGSLPFISANNTVTEEGNYVVTEIVVGGLSWGPDQITC